MNDANVDLLASAVFRQAIRDFVYGSKKKNRIYSEEYIRKYVDACIPDIDSDLLMRKLKERRRTL